MSERLRVAINAQVRPGAGTGGIETVLRVLAALGRLDGGGDGGEEYVFIGPWDEPDWLLPLLGARQTVVRGPGGERRPAPFTRRLLSRAARPLRPLKRIVRRVLSTRAAASEGAPVSDGFYERLGCDVIHFPFQDFVRCALPSVYNPHDLQHLHFPQFFSPEEIGRRETIYRAGCRDASAVVVASSFVKQDLSRRYGVGAEKIQVIPWAPPPVEEGSTSTGLGGRAVLEKYGLAGEPFALYPAMTWEHKNHIRLLEALALLRGRGGPRVRLVCTGHRNQFWPRIEERIAALGLGGQVSFTGVVPRGELSALYRSAQFVIIPTLFEAASAPLFEAWQHSAPVACSAVTSLPEQAGDAALLFDPLSVESIADAVACLSNDDAMREILRRRGSLRLLDFSLERTLKSYRAVYRRAAGRSLCEEDRRLLSMGGEDVGRQK